MYGIRIPHEMALAQTTNWGPSGLRSDQYASDIVADEAALGVLGAAGIRVLSEESGLGECRAHGVHLRGAGRGPLVRAGSPGPSAGSGPGLRTPRAGVFER